MGSVLPPLDEGVFRQRIHRCSNVALSDSSIGSLFLHYRELQRWNPRLSLVGPGTANAVVERHYGESLEALPLIPPDAKSLLDIGSGAGFPGLVLAIARPDLQVTLVEPKERKWAFLKKAAREAGLSCNCLNARVECPLPSCIPRDVDLITFRALALSPACLYELARLSPRAHFLVWCGKEQPTIRGCSVLNERYLQGSENRRILEIGIR